MMIADAPALLLVEDPPSLVAWPDGTVRVRDSRLLLDTVVNCYNGGATAGEIANHYGPTPLCDVLAALAYYERHRGDVDAYLAARESVAEKYWQKIEARPAHKAFVAHAREMMAERDTPHPD